MPETTKPERLHPNIFSTSMSVDLNNLENVEYNIGIPSQNISSAMTQDTIIQMVSRELWIMALEGGYIPAEQQRAGSWPFSPRVQIEPQPDGGILAFMRFRAAHVNNGQVIDTLPEHIERFPTPGQRGIADLAADLEAEMHYITGESSFTTQIMGECVAVMRNMQFTNLLLLANFSMSLGFITAETFAAFAEKPLAQVFEENESMAAMAQEFARQCNETLGA